MLYSKVKSFLLYLKLITSNFVEISIRGKCGSHCIFSQLLICNPGRLRAKRPDRVSMVTCSNQLTLCPVSNSLNDPLSHWYPITICDNMLNRPCTNFTPRLFHISIRVMVEQQGRLPTPTPSQCARLVNGVKDIHVFNGSYRYTECHCFSFSASAVFLRDRINGSQIRVVELNRSIYPSSSMSCPQAMHVLEP